MPFRLFLMLLSLLPFMTDSNPDPDENPDPDPDPDDLGDKGKAALKTEREARKAAEKAAKDAQAELARMKSEAQKAKDAEAAEQGKWKELAEQRETEVSSLTGERDGLKAERDALAEYVKADIAAVTKAVKDAKDHPAAKALMDFHPGDDADPTALLAWAQKAKPRLGELDKVPVRGNGPDPKPGAKNVDEKQATAQARRVVRPI